MQTTPSPPRPPLKAPLQFCAIGECMVEMAPAEAPGTFRMGFAGDTFNTAWYARALRPDWRVRYVTRIGTDAVSDAMAAMMTEAGIDTAHVGRDPQRSVGLYLISLRDGERDFSYWRDTSAARGLADDEATLSRSVQGADVIYLSGITLAIVGPAGREVLFHVMEAARAQGKTVVFDSNLRPRLWDSVEQMRAAIHRAAALCSLALPSHEDEAAAFGDASPLATAERYAEQGAGLVVVKSGAGAVTYLGAGTSGTVVPPRVARIVDTTSAGDSFNAGFMAGIDGPLGLEDRIAAAARIAAQVIGQKGALVPLDLRGWMASRSPAGGIGDQR